MNKKDKQKAIYIIFGVACAVSLITGILLGMLIQQEMIEDSLVEVVGALEGTSFNIEIDVNETIVMDRMEEIISKETHNRWIVNETIPPK